MAINIPEKPDYGFLFDSMNKSSGASNNIFHAIDLSEYHSIKSGVYSKALKTYYAQQAGDSSETSKTEKDDNKKKPSENTAVDKLTEVTGNASALGESAEKLIERGTDSLFRKKDITIQNENGTTEKVEGYDVKAIYNAVSDFAKKYNNFLTSMKNSDSDKVTDEVDGMVKLVKGYEDSLDDLGISIDKDDKLVVDEEAFKASDMEDVRRLFNGNASFSYVVSTKASIIGTTANSEANVMKNYTSNGNYENMLSSMGKLMDSMI